MSNTLTCNDPIMDALVGYLRLLQSTADGVNCSVTCASMSSPNASSNPGEITNCPVLVAKLTTTHLARCAERGEQPQKETATHRLFFIAQVKKV